MSSMSKSNEIGKLEQGLPSGRMSADLGMYLGYVKDNSDAQNMGRIKVWIPEFNTKEDDENGWRVVSYCSPFGGATPLEHTGKDIVDSDQSQISYGFWMTPPDLDNQVIVFFLNGDAAKGYWFGCVYQQNMNNMVPESPTETNYLKNDEILPAKYADVPLPTSEYNKHTTGSVSNKPSRPINKRKMRAIAAQGLIRDPYRGHSSSSSRRGSVSEVYGISTPGPINPSSPSQKGRLGGSSLIMDDGEGSEYVALKTRSGAQIKIDETNGMIYLINRDGTGWIQIDAEGNGDIFCANDLSMRTLRDFNVRADRDVNIEAGRNVNLKASKDHQGEAGMGVGGAGSGSGGIITLETLDSLVIGAETDVIFKSSSFSITTGDMHIKVEGDSNTEAGGEVNMGAGGNVNLESGAMLSAVGSSSVDIDGGMVNLNSGTSNPSSPAEPKEFSAIDSGIKNDNLESFEDEKYKFDRKTQEITSIVGRMPTYEPCPDHTLK